MNKLLTWALVVPAFLFLQGCDNNKTSELDEDNREPSATAANGATATTTALPAQKPEYEVPEEDNGHPLGFLAFWNWFDSDEEPAAEQADAQARSAAPHDDRSSKPWVTEAEEKKEKNHPLAFWEWFSDDEADAKAAEEEAEYMAEEKDEGFLDKLAFWKPWFEDDGKPKRITEDDVLDDLSPELKGRALTASEIKLRNARVRNLRSRDLRDDLADVLLLDRPSRLSRYPTP